VNLRAHRSRGSRLPGDENDGTPVVTLPPAEEIPEEVRGPSQHDHMGEEKDVLEEQMDRHNADRAVPMPLYALGLGIVSGISMPVGAFMGYQLAPVRDTICAAMMAFGAGALLFAVTVELYGHALHEVHEGRMGMVEMNCTMICAVCGAMFYLRVNKWLEETMGGHGDEEHDHDEKAGPGTPKATKDKPSLDRQLSTDTDEGGRTSALAQLKVIEHLEQEKRSLVARSRWKKIRQAITQTSTVTMIHSMKSAAKESESAENTPRESSKETPGTVLSARISKSAYGRAFSEAFAKAFAKVDTCAEDIQEKALLEAKKKKEAAKAQKVALGLFLGLLIDGVPEGVLMGFLAAEGHLTPVFIVSLFVANFPEAFCSASLLKTAEMSLGKVVGMWLGLCLLVGCLCGAACWLIFFCFPNFGPHHEGLPWTWRLVIAGVEGLTGGAMIACISSVMLPEAFALAKKGDNLLMSSGFCCVLGFLLSVFLKANGG